MKKIIFIIMLFLILITKVNATIYGFASCAQNDTPLAIRDTAGGTKISSVPCNNKLEITNSDAGTTSNCSKWYTVKFNNVTGYSCSDYIYGVYEEIVSTLPEENNNQTQEPITPINRSLNGSKANPVCVQNTDPVTVRKSIGGTVLTKLGCSEEFTITNDNAGSNSSCSTWYQIKYGNDQTGYVCGKYVSPILVNTLSVAETEHYKTKLKSDGFPESYIDYLVLLHAKYPNWEFTASPTNLDYNTVIDNELGGRSLIYNTYNEDYRSKEEESYNKLTDTYNRHPTEKNWWYASREAISYFLDPRIYLNENFIFIFEDLTFDSTFHTRQSIINLLNGTFLGNTSKNLQDNTNYIMGAAALYHVSPIHISSRILQEQGVNGSIASLGGSFTYDNKTYSGYYNLFNIGASSSDPNVSPAVIGLVKAMGGVNGTDKSYGKPWNTIEKSIYGGTNFISESYIAKGQGTLYYQKWDISPKSQTRYTHEYMQNITAPVSETLTTKETYKTITGLFDQKLNFVIPVFNEGTMPATTSTHPVNTNPNNYLKELKINDQSVENFNSENYEYNYIVNKHVTKITVSATPISAKTSITNQGVISLNDDTKQKVEVIVTAQNGDVRKYNINITKIDDGQIIKPINEILNNVSVKFNEKYISGINIGTNINALTTNINNYASNNSTLIKVSYKDKSGSVKTEGSFKTGDIITINNGVEDFNYEVVIYGDIDSDGEITILDLLMIKKMILNNISTNNLQKNASDVDKDGNVTILDLLEMKKDILNSKKIVQ